MRKSRRCRGAADGVRPPDRRLSRFGAVRPSAVNLFREVPGASMSVIDQRDKHRFGEDSTPNVAENARRKAASLGVELSVGEDRVKIGDFEVEARGGELRTPFGAYPIGQDEWEILKGLLLNFFASNGRPPDRRELADMYFAASGRPGQI